MTQPSPATVLARLVGAIIGAVKDMGPEGAPAGPLYAALMVVGITYEQFTKIMGVLVERGVLRHSNHLYYYVEQK